MRFILFGLLASTAAIGTLMALGYDSEDAEVLKELAFLVQPASDSSTDLYERPTRLAPGVTILNEDGERLGTIDALATREGKVVTIWAQDVELAGENVTLRDGVALYSLNLPRERLSHGSANAAPK